MPDLHVLEDLGDAECGRPEHPGRRIPGRHQHDPRQRSKPAVELNQVADIVRVGVAQARANLIVDRLKFAPDLLELLGA